MPSHRKRAAIDLDDVVDPTEQSFDSLADDNITEILGHMGTVQKLLFGSVSRRCTAFIPKPNRFMPTIPATVPLLHATASTIDAGFAVLQHAIDCGSADLALWALRRTRATLNDEALNNSNMFPTFAPLLRHHETDESVIRLAVRHGDYQTLMDVDPDGTKVLRLRDLGEAATSEATPGHQQIFVHLQSLHYDFTGDSYIGPIRRNDMTTMKWLHAGGVTLPGSDLDSTTGDMFNAVIDKIHKLNKVVACHATTDTVEWLCDNTSFGVSPAMLFDAAEKGRKDLLRFFLQRCSSISYNKQALAQEAASNEDDNTNFACFRYIIKKLRGAIHAPQDLYNRTCGINGRGVGLRGIRFLRSCNIPCDVDSLLTWVITRNHRDLTATVAYLLEQGARIASCHLQSALERANMPLVDLLLQHGGSIIPAIPALRLSCTSFRGIDAEPMLDWLDAHADKIVISSFYVGPNPIWRVVAWAYARGHRVEHNFGAKNTEWVKTTANYFKDTLKTWDEPYHITRGESSSLRWAMI